MKTWRVIVGHRKSDGKIGRESFRFDDYEKAKAYAEKYRINSRTLFVEVHNGNNKIIEVIYMA